MTDITNRNGGVDSNTTANNKNAVETGGGAHIDGSVAVSGGKVVGRDDHSTTIYEAPAPIATALHQLPAPPADFTGRVADLDAILSDIQRGAVISGLRGMGGIGKTALALVIVDQLKAQYPDAQFYINLQGASDHPLSPRDALQSVIRAYHPTAQLPDDAMQLTALYRSVLAGQRAIILLDDARDAAQIKPLLPPASCLVLITTRNTFAVPGLHARKLETLSPADARDLLIAIEPRLDAAVTPHRDHAMGAGVARRPQADEAILDVASEIARLCGYLPLALRAAASLIAATPDLNPLTYAGQLRDERTRLTKIGAEGVDIDVEASLNLSYQQLLPEAARVFRQLSVFPATFDAAAEEAVCEDADHIHLSQLVRLSLAQYDDTTDRYALHDLTRLFAATAAPSPVSPAVRGTGEDWGGGDDLAAAQRRHAKHYKDVLSTSNNLFLQGNEAILRGLALFDTEWLNIQAGQAWAAAHVAGDQAAAELCDDYPNVGIYALQLRLYPRDQIRWMEAALSGARRLKNKELEGVHLGNLGLAYAALGETRQAIEFHEQALVIAREIGDKRNKGAWLGNLGLAYADLGEMRKAIEFYEQHRDIAREIGDRRGEGNALGNLGIAYANLGETRKAIEFYEQHLVIAREIGDRGGEGNNLGNLGLAYADLGETRKAIEFYEQQLKIVCDIGDRRGEGNALGNLGLAYAALGETRKAIEFYEQALIIDREIGDRRGEGTDLGNLGLAYADLGETRQAIEFYEQHLVIACEIGDRRGEGNASFNMGLALDELGEREKAITYAETTLKIFDQIEDPHAELVHQQLAKWKGA
jgi:tetratricopeptide (TPR) repeat protein